MLRAISMPETIVRYLWSEKVRRIAVLMTCYNRVSTTLTCLRELFQQALPNDFELEVYLVDDASPDGTGSHVKAEFPRVHVIAGVGGLFWCRGMRLAWDKAAADSDYDFYLWLNDDVVLKHGAIASLLADHESVHSVVVGTFSSDADETIVAYGATRSRPTGLPRIADECMNGNLVLIPRDVFKVVGPICGLYHHQYGDYDYGYQLRRKGFQFYVSSKFSGVCPQQPERYLHLRGRSLPARLKLLFEPKGYSLHDAFLYRYRNWGLLRALLSVIHVIGLVVFAVEKKR